MIRLFPDVLALQSGKLNVQYTLVNPHDILTAAADCLQFIAAKKDIGIDVLGAEGLVYADPRLLGQAVQNLLSNALKFSPPGTHVQVWGYLSIIKW